MMPHSQSGLSQRAILDSPSSALHARAAWFVKRELGVGPTELISQRRQAHLVYARALFVLLLRWSSEFASYTIIGGWMSRDHSTVISLKRKADALLERDTDFRRLFEAWQDEEAALKEARHARH